MRHLAGIAILLALVALAPAASAARCPPMCLTAGADPTLPSRDCPECVGLDAHAGQRAPENCDDCATLDVGVSVQHDPDGTTVAAQVCRGGFIYVCPVDEERELPV